MVCCDLFHSTGAATKPSLPIAFLGWTDETENLFPSVRPLDLITDDKLGGWGRGLGEVFGFKNEEVVLENNTM